MIQESKKQVVEQAKKPYTAPELTEHGSVEAQTQLAVIGNDCSHQTVFKVL